MHLRRDSVITSPPTFPLYKRDIFAMVAVCVVVELTLLVRVICYISLYVSNREWNILYTGRQYY